MKQRGFLLDDESGQPYTPRAGSQGGAVHSASSFPLLALSLVIFGFFNLTTDGAWYRAEWLSVHLISNDTWRITGGDAFLGLSMILLFVELVRATSSGGASILNHALSALVFIAALLLFLTRRGFGNSTFFLFTGMTMLDFMAGFIITAVAARRDTMLGM